MWRTLHLFLVLFLIAFATVVAAPKNVIVKLEWKPNPKGDRRPPVLNATGGLYRVRFEALVDKRERGRLKLTSGAYDQVGENLEDGNKVPVLTNSDVAGFVNDQVVRELTVLGIEAGSDDAERVVTWELIDVWVTETNTYQSSVRSRVTVSDKEGKEIWTGLIGGTGQNWGRSLKPVNYVETISNAILNFIDTLAGQQSFQAAIRKAGVEPVPTSVPGGDRCETAVAASSVLRF